LLCLAVNWPGRLNEDSLQQFIGFCSPSDLSDLHSPIVTWLWSLPVAFARQPAAALLVQSTLLAAYAAVLPNPLPSEWRGLAILAAELAFKLSLVVLAGFIIKDVVLVGLLLVALATLQRSRSSERPVPWIFLSLILLALSLFVRPFNFIILGVAAALFLPLALQRWRHYPAALAAACILFSLSLPLYSSFNRYVAKARPGHAEVQLFLREAIAFFARGEATRTPRRASASQDSSNFLRSSQT